MCLCMRWPCAWSSATVCELRIHGVIVIVPGCMWMPDAGGATGWCRRGERGVGRCASTLGVARRVGWPVCARHCATVRWVVHQLGGVGRATDRRCCMPLGFCKYGGCPPHARAVWLHDSDQPHPEHAPCPGGIAREPMVWPRAPFCARSALHRGGAGAACMGSMTPGRVLSCTPGRAVRAAWVY